MDYGLNDDIWLRFVDAGNRVDLERFERMEEAEIACGLLRANGIACELSPPPLPGLTADIVLWVNRRDAEQAWALLADAEREARKSENAARKNDAA